MSLENDTTQPPYKKKKKKSQSPSEENRTWNSDAVLQELRQWPQDMQINWSSFARSHGVPGRNGGQVVTDFAKDHGIDTLALENDPLHVIFDAKNAMQAPWW